jgi:hypothetical protein
MSSANDFITQKAENFRSYLLSMSPDLELKQQLDGYTKEKVMPTLLTVLLPSVAALGVDGVVSEIMLHITAPDTAAVTEKVKRYIQCFLEAI